MDTISGEQLSMLDGLFLMGTFQELAPVRYRADNPDGKGGQAVDGLFKAVVSVGAAGFKRNIDVNQFDQNTMEESPAYMVLRDVAKGSRVVVRCGAKAAKGAGGFVNLEALDVHVLAKS